MQRSDNISSNKRKCEYNDSNDSQKEAVQEKEDQRHLKFNFPNVYFGRPYRVKRGPEDKNSALAKRVLGPYDYKMIDFYYNNSPRSLYGIYISSPESEHSSGKISNVEDAPRTNEEKHESSNQRSGKEKTANEKAFSTLICDKREKTKYSLDCTDRLRCHQMSLVHNTISEKTLAVSLPFQPICVSETFIDHDSQETGPSSKTELPFKSSAVVHREKMIKKKQCQSSHSPDSHAMLWSLNRDNKVSTDLIISAPLPANSATSSCHSISKESIRQKVKKLESEENKKLHKRVNNLGKQVNALYSKSSKPEHISEMKEESKIPKGSISQKRKTNNSHYSDSDDSKFDKLKEVVSFAKISGQTSCSDLENMSGSRSCLVRFDGEETTTNHTEFEAKIPLWIPTKSISSNNASMVTPVVLHKATKEFSLDKLINPQSTLDKSLCTEAPQSWKLTKCQDQTYMSINESHHSTKPSFLVSLDIKSVERLPKLKINIKHCKEKSKTESNVNIHNDSCVSHTEEKSGEHEEEYKHRKAKGTATQSQTALLGKKL